MRKREKDKKEQRQKTLEKRQRRITLCHGKFSFAFPVVRVVQCNVHQMLRVTSCVVRLI